MFYVYYLCFKLVFHAFLENLFKWSEFFFSYRIIPAYNLYPFLDRFRYLWILVLSKINFRYTKSNPGFIQNDSWLLCKIIKWKKLEAIVLSWKCITQSFIKWKQESTSAAILNMLLLYSYCGIRAYLFSPDEWSCYFFFFTWNNCCEFFTSDGVILESVYQQHN